MAYELEFLEHFIYVELRQLNITQRDHIKDFPSIVAGLKEETKAAKRNMQRHLSTLKRQSEVKLYITHLQNAIIALADQLLQYICKREASRIYRCSPTPSATNLCKITFHCLEDLLFHMETYFPFFNVNAPAPKISAIHDMRLLKSRLPVLRNQLTEAGATQNLIDLALSPLGHFLSAPEEHNISFHLLAYFRMFDKELSRLLQNEPASDDFSEKLFKLLYHLNHNSYSFYEHCRAEIGKLIDAHSTSFDRAAEAQRLLALVKSQYHKPGYALRTNRDSLRDDLIAWLTELAQFYRQQLQPEPASPPSADDIRLRTTLTLPMLAYMARMMYQRGIFLDASLASVVRVFIRVFASLKRPYNTYEGFLKEYKNADQKTARAFESLLFELISESKKLYPR